jgi:undecaprenyl-diphosphatase
MEIITGIFLGIIQGLTEFLPISSSGHLVILQGQLGIHEAEILFDVTLHLGTLLAVIVFFRQDLREMITETAKFICEWLSKKESFSSIRERPHVLLTAWVITGTLPTVVIGLVIKDYLEGLFGEPGRAGWMLIITGLILFLTRIIPSGHMKSDRVGLLRSLAVGLAQGMAIIPGISRSGSTIVCGMFCGLKRELAGRFSFLLSIPAIFGAMILQLASYESGSIAPAPMLLGFFSAALTGFFALKILMKIVKKGNLAWFAPYCWILGLIVIFIF